MLVLTYPVEGYYLFSIRLGVVQELVRAISPLAIHSFTKLLDFLVWCIAMFRRPCVSGMWPSSGYLCGIASLYYQSGLTHLDVLINPTAELFN